MIPYFFSKREGSFRSKSRLPKIDYNNSLEHVGDTPHPGRELTPRLTQGENSLHASPWGRTHYTPHPGGKLTTRLTQGEISLHDLP